MLYKIAAITLMLISLSACDQLQSTSNTAILDLDVIAKATGQADVIKQQIEQANAELNAQLTTISSQLNEQLADEKKKMGKKLSKDEQQKLQQLTVLANQKMQQARQIASQKSQQYRAALIQQLRLNIKPIAEKIALARGADIVVTTNNTTIWFNPKIDITDEVIAAVRAQGSSTVTTSTDATPTETQAEAAAEPTAEKTEK